MKKRELRYKSYELRMRHAELVSATMRRVKLLLSAWHGSRNEFGMTGAITV